MDIMGTDMMWQSITQNDDIKISVLMSENQHEFLKKSLLNAVKQILVELENQEVTGIQEKRRISLF